MQDVTGHGVDCPGLGAHIVQRLRAAVPHFHLFHPAPVSLQFSLYGKKVSCDHIGTLSFLGYSSLGSRSWPLDSDAS